MNHTTNYQLPKWEKTDRIQMKDFNDMTATLDAALAAKAEITFGQYTGTGGHGNGNETVLHLGFQPRAVVVFGYATNGGDHMLMVRPYTTARSCDGNNTSCSVKWLDDGVQWVNSFYESTQFNRSGQTYYYLALK